ncbi:MAG: tRNA 4-thiouridine(8) synthase ThiI [Desulfobacterales bacterium]|jgi:tRNA U34 2-thiouridine synthase MnmA/TrmU
MTDVKNKAVRALGLCSGGLDSMLAALVLRRQNIDVAWITFETPFFTADKARAASRITGIPLTVERITDRYLPMLRNPACGYGKNMNPCLDCHTLMFRLAGEHMRAEGFDFLFSGEVLGQRPMSQTKTSLRYVEKHSGLAGYILRPLSALRLPATIPETEGLVDRKRLLNISGRGRKAQIALAEAFGVTEYPAPAGGCLLTDPNYSRRLKDLFDHQQTIRETELELLKYGRHFRFDARIKIIVGRTQEENQKISDHHEPAQDILLRPKSYAGPTVLIAKAAPRAALEKAAAICAGYSKAPREQKTDILVVTTTPNAVIRVRPLPPQKVAGLLI